MKKLITFIIIGILATVSILFAGCTATGTVELKSYTAAEAFREVWEGTRPTPVNALDVTLTQGIDPQVYDTGTESKLYSYINFFFKSNMAGNEMACVQFNITADADVEGTIHFEYGCGDTHVECGRFDYSLQANKKTLLTFDFAENFIVGNLQGTGRNQLVVDISSKYGKGSSAWYDWADVAYSISDFEIGLNEAAEE